MKWFVTQDVANIVQRLTDAGEEVVSTPEMQRDPSDPDMEDHRDYRLSAYINEVGDFDVLFLGNIGQSPFYSNAPVSLWCRQGGKVLVGSNDYDPKAYYASMRGPRCRVGIRKLAVYATNDISLKNRMPPMLRVVDINGDIQLLIKAVIDAKNVEGHGKLYV